MRAVALLSKHRIKTASLLGPVLLLKTPPLLITSKCASMVTWIQTHIQHTHMHTHNSLSHTHPSFPAEFRPVKKMQHHPRLQLPDVPSHLLPIYRGSWTPKLR